MEVVCVKYSGKSQMNFLCKLLENLQKLLWKSSFLINFTYICEGLYYCEVQLSKHMKIATADRMLYCDRRAVLEDVILLFIGIFYINVFRRNGGRKETWSRDIKKKRNFFGKSNKLRMSSAALEKARKDLDPFLLTTM